MTASSSSFPSRSEIGQAAPPVRVALIACGAP